MPVEIVLGIDPGANGAIAFLDESGALLDVVDMPSLPEPKARPKKSKTTGEELPPPVATNAPLLAEILAKSQATRIYCEFVAARPTDGKAHAFAFGRARGVIEGCAGALNIPVTWVATNVWKRASGVPPGKENKNVALTRAVALWPQHAALFKLKKNVDRAEAALIGLVGLKRGVLVPPPKRKKSAQRADEADLLTELERGESRR